MHSYTAEENGKSKVIFDLAIFSSILASGISTLFHPVLQDVSSKVQIPEIATYSVSSGAIFAILWLLCVKFLWKAPFVKSLFRTPCLNGTWNCIGKGKKYKSNEENDWNAEIIIEQDLEKISVFQRNNLGTSVSSSVSASIRKINTDIFELSYLYRNIPQEQELTLHSHTGVAIITFDMKQKTATGVYYTDLDRQSYGEMILRKVR